jgi:hypothetical protein
MELKFYDLIVIILVIGATIMGINNNDHCFLFLVLAGIAFSLRDDNRDRDSDSYSDE